MEEKRNQNNKINCKEELKIVKTNILVWILGMSLVLTGFVSADMGDGSGCFGGMGGMMTGSYGYGGMFYGWAFGLLTLVALILLVIWLVKQIQKK